MNAPTAETARMNRAYRANTRKRQRAATAMMGLATAPQMNCRQQAVQAKVATVGSRSKRRRAESSTSVHGIPPQIAITRTSHEPLAVSTSLVIGVPEGGSEGVPLAVPGLLASGAPASILVAIPGSVPVAAPGSLPAVTLAQAPVSLTAASPATVSHTTFDGAAAAFDVALPSSLGMWEEAFGSGMAEAVGREAEGEDSVPEPLRIVESYFPVSTELQTVSIQSSRTNSSTEAVDLAGTALPSTSNRSMELGRSSRPIDVDDDEDVREVSPMGIAPSRRRREHLCNGGLGAFAASVNIRPMSNMAVAQSTGVTTIDLEASPPQVDLTDDTCGDDCVVLSEAPQMKPRPRPGRIGVPPPFNLATSNSVAERTALTCSICMDTMKEETSTNCGHVFCRHCILAAIKTQKKCPTCRKKLTTSQIHRIYI